jgi:hypothetical protein
MITGTTVEVTQADIDEATAHRGDVNYSPSCGCPVTLATRRALPTTKWTAEGTARIGNRLYRLSSTASRFINNFDARKHVKPFSFVVGEEISGG